MLGAESKDIADKLLSQNTPVLTSSNHLPLPSANADRGAKAHVITKTRSRLFIPLLVLVFFVAAGFSCVSLTSSNFDQELKTESLLSAVAAVKQNPGAWSSYLNLANAQLYNGQYDESLASLDRAVNLSGGNPTILTWADESRKLVLQRKEANRKR